jgi:hypothetical protein
MIFLNRFPRIHPRQPRPVRSAREQAPPHLLRPREFELAGLRLLVPEQARPQLLTARHDRGPDEVYNVHCSLQTYF